MSYAIRKDGKGWRSVSSSKDVGPDEVFGEDEPPISVDLAAEARVKRNLLLSSADYEVNRCEDVAANSTAWRAYRQELRDVPEQAGFPENIDWPTAPDL